MAKIINLLFFMFMFVLGSCNNDVPEITIEKFIETSEHTILFDANGESKELFIYSNTEWKVTSSATWCNVSAAQGADTAQVVIAVDKNILAENRNAELWVEAETLQKITIEIRQSAADSLANNEEEEEEEE
ncbi:MAG: BACON domain-containing protein, partial [Prolixibacteraceae bacterium]|nr:BACON domain-containing protein [Prolixibacteraceae bacterium]